MKLPTLILIMFLAVVAQPALPQQANVPLGKDQVMTLVKAEMATPELVKLIHDHGIDFDVTDDYVDALRKAGAQEAVIQALRVVRPKPLTQDQVMQLVAQGVPAERAVALVKQRGIDFVADDRYLQTLRLAGGDDALIAAVREASKPVPGEPRVNPKDGLKYVWVPPGTFMMGCSPGDNECQDNEKPAHQVTITKGFWIGQTVVTVGAYKRFAVETGHQMPPMPVFNNAWTNENMPIVNVTWEDAQAYCGWMGGELPTEAEWEYAARGGSAESRYGDIDSVAWYSENSGNHTHDVAQKPANGFGLFDMLGNVWEWVNDWYDGQYNHNSPLQDPTGAENGSIRVLRGGAWSSYARYVRASNRYGHAPSSRNLNDGFRCGGGVGSP